MNLPFTGLFFSIPFARFVKRIANKMIEKIIILMKGSISIPTCFTIEMRDLVFENSAKKLKKERKSSMNAPKK